MKVREKSGNLTFGIEWNPETSSQCAAQLIVMYCIGLRHFGQFEFS